MKARRLPDRSTQGREREDPGELRRSCGALDSEPGALVKPFGLHGRSRGSHFRGGGMLLRRFRLLGFSPRPLLGGAGALLQHSDVRHAACGVLL